MFTPFELLFVQPAANSVTRRASRVKCFMGVPGGCREKREAGRGYRPASRVRLGETLLDGGATGDLAA